MANLLYGKVYYKDIFAGFLQEEPGDQISFKYDINYIAKKYPAISYTLPTSKRVHTSHGLHPFFDNLVAEGWLAGVQRRILGKRNASRFELLLAFGFDCGGAVSVIDPEHNRVSSKLIDMDVREKAILASRASLSGIQAKLAVVQDNGVFRPTNYNELSTHIAKFPSSQNDYSDMIENEYLTTLALNVLLPSDQTVHLSIHCIEPLKELALVVQRFDRFIDGCLIKRIHFEEFNQLLEKASDDKYKGSYKDIADFIRCTNECLPTEAYLLYKRILAGLLLGNTDMHLKNFAMLYTSKGLRLTPSYDQVAAVLYGYKTVALSLAGVSNFLISYLKSNHLIQLGKDLGLTPSAIRMAIDQLDQKRNHAIQKILESKIGSSSLKDKLIDWIEKRWNGTYALIGKKLSRKL